ncbi:hypothetical protein [Chthonobacter rhizosphaerae]|uniref:hypothetical protein n=1 Tax=Chthonobacter rhizosphaerae TaxID=2735553 RepID=UPI0015EF5B6B|nr:hypothetical protein [Chthonobacter rhizosphaerae]
MNTKTYRAMSRSAHSSATAAFDVATTLWFRMPILFAAPTASSMKEWERAWSEKVEAAMNGTIAAGLATQRMGMMMAAGMVAAEALPIEMLRITEAATAPGYKAVAANARRLSRAKSRR